MADLVVRPDATRPGRVPVVQPPANISGGCRRSKLTWAALIIGGLFWIILGVSLLPPFRDGVGAGALFALLFFAPLVGIVVLVLAALGRRRRGHVRPALWSSIVALTMGVACTAIGLLFWVAFLYMSAHSDGLN
jgi:hypothetical protein